MKKILFLIVLISPIICNGQEYVKVKTSIPSNNANNAQGEKSAVWRNSVMAPSTSDNFPNNQNWWTIFQAQFQDTRYDAQLAFGLNKQDLWLRFNYNDAWKPWKKIVLEDENGKVGIGTSIPKEKLDLIGNMRVEGEVNIREKTSITDGDIRMYNFSGDTWGFIMRPYDADFHGGSWNWEKDFGYRCDTKNWYVESKFAIGTTVTGSHRLAVEGSIGAREIKVEANGWSDFVFKPGYNLSSLENLEQYIAQNKHLPDIPSESEVKENGINLGEINAKLLQKIEELTLYVIDLNKRMKKLEHENTELKKGITTKNQH